MVLLIGLVVEACLSVNHASFAQEHLNFQNAPEGSLLKSLLEVEPIKNTSEDSIIVDGRVYYKKKDSDFRSPYKAFAIGFFPGFFVHGLGHLYAGDKRKFKILLLTEGIWVGSLLIIAPLLTYSPDSETENPLNESQFLGVSLALLYLCPWIYDFIGSPMLVLNQKKKIMDKYTFAPSIKVIEGDRQISLRLSYHF